MTPNRCAACPREGCTLFSAAPGEQATLCGSCAHAADPQTYRRTEPRRADDADLCAALAQANRDNARQAEEIRRQAEELIRLRRALRNAHDANAATHDFYSTRGAA